MFRNKRPRIVLVNRCFVMNRSLDKLLIIQRALDNSYNPGKWEVPGGKLEQGQDISYAQEREVMKETGLLVESVRPLVLADSYVINTGKYRGLTYLALFSITRLLDGFFRISEEHCGFTWVSYKELLTYQLTDEVRNAAITLERVLSVHMAPLSMTLIES